MEEDQTVDQVSSTEPLEDDEESTTNNSEVQDETDESVEEVEETVENEDDTNWQSEAEKWKTTAENYKKENEKYRKTNRTKEINPIEKSEYDDYSDDSEFIFNDFRSKQSNVLAKFEDKINSLPQDVWENIETKIGGAMNGAYLKARKGKTPVAEYTLEKELNDLISWAEGQNNHQTQIEKARAEGEVAKKQLKNAEISTKTNKRVKSNILITSEDRRLAESTGQLPEEVAKKRQRRDAIRDDLSALYK